MSTDECGIYQQTPKSVPKGAEWQYQETILLGYTTKTKEEFEQIIQDLQAKWPRNAYHVLTNNCNNFTDTVANLLVGNGSYLLVIQYSLL
jgi:hypothetical protein